MVTRAGKGLQGSVKASLTLANRSQYPLLRCQGVPKVHEYVPESIAKLPRRT